MTDPIRIQIDARAAQAALDRAARELGELTPIMRAIGGVLADATERAFAAEADPATGTPWVDLAPGTRRARARKGKWPGQKLQVSGQLAASITTEVGDGWVEIGSNKVYAGIHQIGGRAGRRHAATIPPRPYLGLGPTDLDDVVEIVERHLAAALKSPTA